MGALQADNEQDARASQQLAIGSLEATQAELERQLAQLSGRVAATETSGLDAELSELKALFSNESSVNGAHRQRIEMLEQQLIAASERISAGENALAALAVRGESPARRMEMAEVDYLLRTASERLQLFADRRSAERALALADAQLLAIDDPLYTPVRQQIAAARLQLDAMPAVDVVLLNEAISALQERVPALPLRGQFARASTRSAPAAGVDGPADPGIWARFKAALASLVTVQRRNPEQALVSIGDQQYVRQGLWLQLESARLALMRRDSEAYAQALGRASDVIGQFFALEAPAVENARASIAELLEAPLQTELPDISGPWAELQRLNQVRTPPAPDPGQAPTPAPAPAPATSPPAPELAASEPENQGQDE